MRSEGWWKEEGLGGRTEGRTGAGHEIRHLSFLGLVPWSELISISLASALRPSSYPTILGPKASTSSHYSESPPLGLTPGGLFYRLPLTRIPKPFRTWTLVTADKDDVLQFLHAYDRSLFYAWFDTLVIKQKLQREKQTYCYQLCYASIKIHHDVSMSQYFRLSVKKGIWFTVWKQTQCISPYLYEFLWSARSTPDQNPIHSRNSSDICVVFLYALCYYFFNYPCFHHRYYSVS